VYATRVQRSLLLAGVVILTIDTLVAPAGPPVRRIQEIRPVRILSVRRTASIHWASTPAPRLCWQLRSSRRGVRQAAYQIRAAETAEQLRAGHALIWDSNRIAWR
jgi:hypothetical protein